MESPTLTIVSLGAGVQSSTMLLMAADGEFDRRPDYAIFADTQWEPPSVYAYLDWLEEQVAGRIPILRVTAGNIQTDLLQHTQEGTRVANPPFFVKTPGGSREGVLRRGCTIEYKVQPITAKTKQLLGVGPGKRVPKGTTVERWFGISMDEVHRMKPAPNKWERNRYPLIEKGMDRHGCLRWLSERGYPLPTKSACVGCPYRSDRSWREMRDKHPDLFQQAVEWDAAMRTGMKGVNGEVYIHRSLLPLGDVDLRTRREKGQSTLWEDDEDGFGNECEGHCGV